MKRIACLFVSAFFLAGGIAYAQGEMNAYTMSQTDLNGTARYFFYQSQYKLERFEGR